MTAARHSTLVCCAAAAVATILLGRPAAAQTAYTVLDLGRAPEPPMPPAPYSCSPCVDQMLMNAKGQLVISRRLQGFSIYYWEPGMSAAMLMGRADDTNRAVAISSNGYFVGTSDGGAAVPFLWSKAAGFKPLCCADTWYPLGVNASGVVVGTRLFGEYRAVVWTSRDPTYLDDLDIAGKERWTFAQAQTISDDGTIAGIGHLRTSAGALQLHYFVLTPTVGGGTGALDRTDWTASATESAPGEPPSNAIDGNLSTRFTTGQRQHDSQGFSVSWPGDRTVGRIRMDVGPSTNDYPRTCGIWVTDTSGNVTFIDCSADTAGVVDVSFTPLAVHKIEVWQWGGASSWWSIAEFNAFTR
jgi:hypothetical protein